MALQITKTNDTKATGVTALIYGDPGVGKTTLLGTIPGKTLILDVEGGTSVLRDKEIDVVRIKDDLSNLKEIFEEVKTGTLNYNTICLDSATELEKFMLLALADTGKNGGIPGLKDYGTVQYKMRDYLRVLRDLRDRGINVIICALEMQVKIEEADGTVKSKAYPMMMTKLAPEVCGLYDIVGRVEVSRKEDTAGQRFIRLDGNETFVAKDRIFKRTYCVADGAELLNGPANKNNK